MTTASPITPPATTLLAELLGSLTKAAAHAADDYRRAFTVVERRAHRSLGADERQAPFIGRWIAGQDVEPLTFFHSRDIPTVSLGELFHRVRKYWPKRFDSDDGDVVGLYAVVLVRRYRDHTTLPITSAMLHRLFLTAVLVAGKVHHDDPVSNSRFAARIGLQATELARMERALLAGIDYRAIVTVEQIAPAAMRAQLISPAVAPTAAGRNTLAAAADDDADFIAGGDHETFVDSGRAPTPPEVLTAPPTAQASPTLIPIVN